MLELGLFGSSLFLLGGSKLLLVLHYFVEIDRLLLLSSLYLSPDSGFSKFAPDFLLTLGLLCSSFFSRNFSLKFLSGLTSFLLFLTLLGKSNLLFLVLTQLLFRNLNWLSRDRDKLLVATLRLGTSGFRFLWLGHRNGNWLFNFNFLLWLLRLLEISQGLSFLGIPLGLLRSLLISLLLSILGKRGGSRSASDHKFLGLLLRDLLI